MGRAIEASPYICDTLLKGILVSAFTTVNADREATKQTCVEILL